MTTTTNKLTIRLTTIILATFFLASCAQYGMISQNDVYLQKPSELSLGEDETDLTSYYAYKAKERGVYQDQYLIDQMHDRRLLGASLYGVRPMFGAPYPPGSFLLTGDRLGILFYQGTFYHNSMYAWNRPWNYGFGYACGYNPHFPYNNGLYGYGCMNNPYHPYGFGGPLVNGGQNGTYGGNNNGGTVNSSVYTGRPRMSLSTNSARSSSYPSTLKSTSIGGSGSYTTNDQTLGSSRRAVQSKQAVRSSHMPFKSDQWRTQGSSTYKETINGNNAISSSRTRSNYSSSNTNRYSPSSSARRSGVARSPRSSVNSSTRTTYSTGSQRRSTPSNTNYSRSRNSSGSFNSGSRGYSGSSSSSSGSRRSSSSSSSSSSGRR